MSSIPSVHERLQRLDIPVIAAPMFLISGPDLVIECCRAGIVGSFPAPNVRTSEELEAWLSRVSMETAGDAPWALNLVTHRTNPRLPRDLELVAKYRPPIVITALGSPAPVIETVHAYGGLVFADVNSVPYARKAAATGVDGLVLVCAGAGGHTGELCNTVFVEEVRAFFDGYLAVAGGFGHGTSILAARAMGGDFAYVGTRFIAASESLAEDDYRTMLTECSASDLVVTKAFTGARASMLIPSILAQGLDLDTIKTDVARMNFTGLEGAEVKPWKGIWGAGQGVGSIKRVEPVAAIVATMTAQYRQACDKMKTVLEDSRRDAVPG